MSEKLEVIYYPSVDNMKLFVIDIEYRSPHTHPEIEVLFLGEYAVFYILYQQQITSYYLYLDNK